MPKTIKEFYLELADGTINYEYNVAEQFGPELVSNGKFNTDVSGWASNAGTQAWVAGSLRRTSGGAAGGSYQDVPITAGKTIRLSSSITLVSGAGATRVFAYDGASFTTQIANLSASGFVDITPTQSSLRLYLYTDSTSVVDYDNISVKEVLGPVNGKVIINGALTTPELTLLQSYASKMAGL